MEHKTRELLEALLLLIPMGKVTTYSSLAKVLGLHPRTVGKMLSKNEKLIVVPCHRVVRSDGSLGGYKLGVEFKRKLLMFEGVKFCGEKVCKESIIDVAELFGLQA